MEGTVKFSSKGSAIKNSALSKESPINPNEKSTGFSQPIFSLKEIKLIHSNIKQIWAIGGGKGGVGKSMIASSMAISLARLGHRVIAIDLDLGGANLHTTLGIDLPKLTLSDFINKRVRNISDCLVRSGIPNLEILSGAQDSVGISNLETYKKIELLKKIKTLDADYLILDLGAGTGFNTLDFYLFSDIGFVTLLPEPTSIENGYRFVKSAYYRHLSLSPLLQSVRPLIETAMDPNNSEYIRSPADLFREVNRLNPEVGLNLKREIEMFQPKLIINQARTQTDVDIGSSVKTVCKKYFGINIEYIGSLDHDSAVWQSVRKKRPLVLEFPNSKISSSIEKIVHNLLRPNTFVIDQKY